MTDRDLQEYANDGDVEADEDEAWNELMDRRAAERRERERRQPELHGRPVSPAVVEHEAQAAQPLRDRIAAIAPQDPEGTTRGDDW